jgi:hypothetical protein
MTKKLWPKVLLGGFLIELALMIPVVPIFALVPNPDPLLNAVIPPATLLVAVLMAFWVARRAERPLFVGAMVGVAALVVYGLLAGGAYLASPENFNPSQSFGPAYLASHVLKVVGGVLGGWWVGRRRGG